MEIFRDDNGSWVEMTRMGEFNVLRLSGQPERGYVTDATWGDIDPGPCIAWFGPEEKYHTPEDVIAVARK